MARKSLVLGLLVLLLAGFANPSLPPAQEGLTPSQATFYIQIGTSPSIPGFDTPDFTVQPGAIVSLTLRNNSTPELNYRHSWVLTVPGRQGAVANAADRAGPLQGYIPNTPDILARTRMLDPGESETILFRAPTTPGDYPYICTFPGHAEAMNGVMLVKK
jgi:azurin